jgi:hypothetical protein
VTIGGGVTPDVAIASVEDDPWLTFVTQRGYITSYAEGFLTTHSGQPDNIEITPQMLDEFRDYLLGHGIRVPDEFWPKDQEKIKVRMKVEITTLVQGLELADELATESDPQAQQAAGLFPRVGEILKGH